MASQWNMSHVSNAGQILTRASFSKRFVPTLEGFHVSSRFATCSRTRLSFSRFTGVHFSSLLPVLRPSSSSSLASRRSQSRLVTFCQSGVPSSVASFLPSSRLTSHLQRRSCYSYSRARGLSLISFLLFQPCSCFVFPASCPSFPARSPSSIPIRQARQRRGSAAGTGPSGKDSPKRQVAAAPRDHPRDFNLATGTFRNRAFRFCPRTVSKLE